MLSAAYLLQQYWWFVLAMIPILIFSIRFTSIQTISLFLLLWLTFLGPRLLPFHQSFVINKLIGIVLFAMCVLLIPPLRRGQHWFQIGQINRRSYMAVFALVVVSACSLLLWSKIAEPNTAGYHRLLPEMSAIAAAVYILLFAVINSAIEEVMWRGVMQTALENALGSGWLALIIQAVSFGIAHIHGPFLYGWLGVVLTTLFGVLAGLLRQKTQGMVAPWAAHAGSDFVILCLVYWALSG